MSENQVLLYHMIFGGKIQTVADAMKMSTSHVHKILDKAKNKGLYDWKVNKKTELTKAYIKEYGKDVMQDILAAKAASSKEYSVSLHRPKKIIAIADAHYPFNIPFTCFERFLGDYQPDVLR